ncbi:MAG: thiamine pyrophosphate-dependent enzyme, partial [Deltaproteobacteria bacterium]|nr:thiamine pyrophosphate-dependent enzyme [Deltaproteobacteria bacterium]
RTLMGTGVIKSDDSRFIGMIGSHGNAIANQVVRKEADLIIAVGTRFGDRSIIKTELFAKNAKVIHIDIDPAEIGKNIKIDIPIVGDIKEVLKDINERLEKNPIPRAIQWKKVGERKSILPTFDSASVMKNIFEELSKIDIKLNISTDVGRHQMWANHFCTNAKHLPLITSGGLGTMGFGLPAAIGAWFAEKETPVLSLSGDGSFMMNMQEFSVAVEEEVPLTVILLNDRRLGMIKELQTTKYAKRFIAHELGSRMNFALLAEAMGGVGIDVHHHSKIKSSIEGAISSRKPTIINFDLEKIESSLNLSLSSAVS